ncbi:MAG: hypothetical protein WBG34_08865, partial [Flavobacteriales bacterium]
MFTITPAITSDIAGELETGVRVFVHKSTCEEERAATGPCERATGVVAGGKAPEVRAWIRQGELGAPRQLCHLLQL